MKLSRHGHAAAKLDVASAAAALPALCAAIGHAKRQGCAALGEEALDAPGAA